MAWADWWERKFDLAPYWVRAALLALVLGFVCLLVNVGTYYSNTKYWEEYTVRFLESVLDSRRNMLIYYQPSHYEALSKLLDWRELGGEYETLEAYLVRRNGGGREGERGYCMASASRFLGPDPSGCVSVPTVAAVNAFEGRTGCARIEDYRGVTVLSCWAPMVVGERESALVAEIDWEEALRPSRELRARMAVMQVWGLGLLLATVLPVYLSMVRLRRRAARMLEMATEMVADE